MLKIKCALSIARDHGYYIVVHGEYHYISGSDLKIMKKVDKIDNITSQINRKICYRSV